jgi:hypothetical protein
VKGILVYSNEGDSLSPREDNSGRVKNTLNMFKNLLQSQQTKFNQTWYKLSMGYGQMKGQVLVKGEIITKM